MAAPIPFEAPVTTPILPVSLFKTVAFQGSCTEIQMGCCPRVRGRRRWKHCSQLGRDTMVRSLAAMAALMFGAVCV